MFKLGEIKISAKVVYEIKLQDIFDELILYRDEAFEYYVEKLDGQEVEEMIDYRLAYCKDVYQGRHFVMHIETLNSGGTEILDPVDYMKRDIANFANSFSRSEMDFIMKSLLKLEYDGTRFENRYAEKLQRRFKDIETKKQYLRNRKV